MTRDYSFDERRAGPGLPDDENRRWIVVSCLASLEPVGRESLSERLVHCDLGLLVELDRCATGGRAASKRLECLVPFLEILEFLAEAEIKKRKRPGVPVLLLHEFLQIFDVVPFCRFANTREYPMRLCNPGLYFQDFAQYRFCLVELAQKHVVVGLVDEIRYTVRLFLHSALVPRCGFFLITEQAMDGADQIKHGRVAIVVFDGIGECRVRAYRLAHKQEKARQICPCRAMVFFQFRDRPECADCGDVLLELQGYEADQEMSLDKIGLCTQQSLAALRRLVQPARR